MSGALVRRRKEIATEKESERRARTDLMVVQRRRCGKVLYGAAQAVPQHAFSAHPAPGHSDPAREAVPCERQASARCRSNLCRGPTGRAATRRERAFAQGAVHASEEEGEA
ncbi:uncharacterized protein A4U43_C09F13620 [Asparagus officinalis]|uniref:Uncharacterized protein n=1 Tax=Asparagus officinalis TaxID=4686 RepID=A0A5P1E793_ASPOF|nr:uncharacterized protein A4U43_C09F13620 [Asparagus officinalis]